MNSWDDLTENHFVHYRSEETTKQGAETPPLDADLRQSRPDAENLSPIP